MANRTAGHFLKVRTHIPSFRAEWDAVIVQAYPLVEAAVLADALESPTGSMSALALREYALKQRSRQLLLKHHWQIGRGGGSVIDQPRKAETGDEIRNRLLREFEGMRTRMDGNGSQDCGFAPSSEAERFALLESQQRQETLDQDRALAIAYDWRFWRREDQAPPLGDWRIWFVMAGRGFGKTRMAAEWVRDRAMTDGDLRIALVGATLHEARTIMIEGEAGMLAVSAPDEIASWEPSLRKLTWKNGAIATIYSAAEPDSLRGPSHHIGWADEIAKWDDGIPAWDNLSMTLRLGGDPRIVATSTPRPVPLVRRLLKEKDVRTTRGRSHDNIANLPPNWVAGLASIYGGTRLGRQELDGELLDDVEGALWKRAVLEAARVPSTPELTRVVIGVDPPAGSVNGNGGDACGIVAAGLGDDDIIYVLDDASVSGMSPSGWARAVAAAASTWNADRVVAEANNGGRMVEECLRGADVQMPVKLVHASRGKVARAEPVSTRYEGGKVKHAGAFPELEDEMCGLMIGGGYQGPGRSPDRADALVWAVTELMEREVKGPEPRIRLL